jgi:hypothetical protein
MTRLTPLPPALGSAFSVSEATLLGVSPGRLRGRDLLHPFHGVRMHPPEIDPALHPLETSRIRELARLHALARRLAPGQFFSHLSAARLWGIPLPGHFEHPERASIHLSVHSPGRAPRVTGVRGHRIAPERCPVVDLEGLPTAAPANTWAMLGGLGLSPSELVAAGDHLVRVSRAGHGRRDVGKPPLTTVEELHAAVELGRWSGAPALAQALALVREDSWSPQESLIRVGLVRAGLPEPELNVDVFDGHGGFLGCVDLAYRKYRVGIEYYGQVHSTRFAQDVERIASLREADWEMVEVTRAVRGRPRVVAERVRRALEQRGWRAEGSAA